MPQESPASPLAQWYVISLRPQNLHAGVRKAASALGARCFAMSPLRLRPLDAGRDLAQALACPRILATSPAAVRMAHAQHPLDNAKDKTWLTVGRGSARALHRLGIQRVLVPENGADSSALLAHPELQDIHGQRIGLITAPGGRGLLEKTLRERGARLAVAHVYRRETCAFGKARIAALATLPETTALMVSSGEAFEAAWRQFESRMQETLRRRPAIASSQRLAEMLVQNGFVTCLVARDASPKSMLAALAAHVSSGRFR